MWIVRQSGCAAKDNQAPTCARQHHVQPSPVSKKPHSATCVATYRTENDEFLLATLKGVHGSDFQEPWVHASWNQRPEQLTKASDLRSVWRYNPNVIQRQLSSAQHLAHQSQHLFCFRRVILRISLSLLSSMHVYKGHGNLSIRPRYTSERQTNRGVDATAEGAIVKHLRTELHELGMTPVLRVQESGLNTTTLQTAVDG